MVKAMDRQSKLTQIVPSPEAAEAKRCLENNQLFKDPAFPPNAQSLNVRLRPADMKDIKFKEWKPLHSLYKNPHLFVDEISAPDVRQGRLGSCYLLAGLSALAETPKRIQDVFLTKEINAAHYYSVKILYRGVWREVIVDDYIPMVN